MLKASISNFLPFLFLITTLSISAVCGQGGRKNGGNGGQFNPVPANPDGRRDTCPREVRTLSGMCNNLRRPLWGSAGRPHLNFRGQFDSFPTKNLPSARLVSNVICNQEEDINIFNKRNLSEFVVFFGQFIDHSIISTPTNKSTSMNIKIPKSDHIFYNFSNHELPFHNSIRLNNSPINSLSSFMDLSTIYSANEKRLNSLRTYKRGMLKYSMPGNLLPLNEEELVNAPTKSSNFFLSGDHRSNEHPILTSLHTLFFREHNRLCMELLQKFPYWSDSRLFANAKKINIAQFQKIVFEEWYPQITGRKLPKYKRYNKRIDPSISNIFATAAFRIGHTMIGNQITRIASGTDNVSMKPVRINRMFFTDAKNSPLRIHGIEPFLKGSMYTRAQEVDTLVVPALRNFLFNNVKEETGFDLVALNIQRGRDHGLPSYNDIRVLFGRKRAKTFEHITKNIDVQSKLQTVYGHVDNVEAWVGLVAEDHARSSSLGPTTLRIFRSEFLRLRNGDRFYFRRWWMFPHRIRNKLPRIKNILTERNTMMKILLRNTNLRYKEIRKIWYA